jgi:gliding motility-associated-like protein
MIFNGKLLALLAVLLLFHSQTAGQVLNTYSGNGSIGFSGDGGPALSASFNGPGAIAISPSGSFIAICDKYNHKIRKIDSQTGTVTTIAGTGIAGFAGDGGKAVNALLNGPHDLFIDGNNNIIFYDELNFRIRKIDALSNIITTIAGNGTTTPLSNVPATQTGLLRTNITADQENNIYISETSLGIIRKIDAQTGIITKIAGNGSSVYSGDGGPALQAGIPSPHAVNLDAEGNIYFTDLTHHTIRKIDKTSQIITTIAGTGERGYSGDGGPAKNAALSDPLDIIADNSGNLFIADGGNNVVRKIDVNSKLIFTVAGDGSQGYNGEGLLSTCSKLDGPSDLAADKDGNIYIADFFNNRIRKLEFKSPEPLNAGITIRQVTPLSCGNDGLRFAAITKAGNFQDQLAYNWKINGKPILAYNDNVWINQYKIGDTVSCELSGINNLCLPFKVESNFVVITVDSSLLPQIKISANRNTICSGENILLNAIIANPGQDPRLSWYRNNETIATDVSTFSFSAFNDGDKLYCVMTTNIDGCSSTSGFVSDTITFNVNPIPLIELLPADTVIEKGGSVKIRANASNDISSISWNPVSGLNLPTVLDPEASPIISQQYILTVVSQNGCRNIDSVKVIVKSPLYIPNAFTPNGDSKNDLFKIPAGHGIDNGNLSIYDRWGNLVYSTTDLNKGWDGTLKEKNMPSGTYVYMLTGLRYNQKITLKGTITLIR